MNIAIKCIRELMEFSERLEFTLLKTAAILLRNCLQA